MRYLYFQQSCALNITMTNASKLNFNSKFLILNSIQLIVMHPDFKLFSLLQCIRGSMPIDKEHLIIYISYIDGIEELSLKLI